MADKNSNRNADNVNQAYKIFTKYGDFVYGVFRSKVKDEAHADDLCQDFFLSLVSDPIPLDVRNIESYLYRRITNDIIDASRRMEKYRTFKKDYAKSLDFSINKNGSRNAHIIDEGKMNKVFKFIKGQLFAREAKAVILRYRDNCNNQEIAKELNVKKGSVSSYICRGLKKIRQFFEGKGDSYNDNS